MKPLRREMEQFMSNAPDVHAEFDRRYMTCGAALVLLVLGSSLIPRDGSVVELVAVDVRSGVDPDAAPWWELAALPRIGESTARAIVEHRETVRVDGARVFREPADLERVKGIGPKTVQRTAKHLRFE